MNSMLLPIFLMISGLMATPATGQDYAPASIPVSSSVDWASTVTENYGEGPEEPYFEEYSLTFTSTSTFEVPPDTTGTFTYTKTGANTATITYNSYTDDGSGFTENEGGAILLTFNSSTGGTFTNSGSFDYEYLGLSGNGTFTSDGSFIYSPTLAASPIEIWQNAKFGSVDDPDAALDIDADNDGLDNILEYAFKLEPKVPGTPVLTTLTGITGLPRITTNGAGSTQRLRLEYLRRKASSNPGIIYTPQFSSTLNDADWSSITGPETIQSIDTEWERVVVEDSAGIGLPRRFGRVRVTVP